MALQSIVSRRSIPPTGRPDHRKIEGGTRSNIIADKVVLEEPFARSAMRTGKRSRGMIENLVKGLTQSPASYTLNYNPALPSSIITGTAKNMLPSLIRLFGEEKVKNISPQMVSEDFLSSPKKSPPFTFFWRKTPGRSRPAPSRSNSWPMKGVFPLHQSDVPSPPGLPGSAMSSETLSPKALRDRCLFLCFSSRLLRFRNFASSWISLPVGVSTSD